MTVLESQFVRMRRRRFALVDILVGIVVIAILDSLSAAGALAKPSTSPNAFAAPTTLGKLAWPFHLSIGDNENSLPLYGQEQAWGSQTFSSPKWRIGFDGLAIK